MHRLWQSLGIKLKGYRCRVSGIGCRESEVMTDRLTRIEAAVEELKKAFQDYAGQPSSASQEFAVRDLGKPSKFAELHETDFMVWCEAQAEILRTCDFKHLDLIQLIDEIEDMGVISSGKRLHWCGKF